MRTERLSARTRLIAVSVLLVAWAARLAALGDIPFWYDEGLVGWSARLDFLSTARWTAADVHPPLYFWAVTVWRLFAGETEFALRLLSAIFGFLCVVVVYKIGARLQGAWLGILAALFIGIGRFDIWWSQELRMYILGSMFMLFSIWLTLRIMHGKPKRSDWIAYILVSAAGLLTIYLVAFALAFESLYATILLAGNYLTRWQRRKANSPPAPAAAAGAGNPPAAPPAQTDEGLSVRKYLQWAGAQGIVILIFLPWFLYFLTQFRTWSDSNPFDFKLFVQLYATLLAVGVPSSIDDWIIPVSIMWAVLALGALIGLRGRHDGAARRGGWLVVLLLVLPPLSVYLGTTPRSFFYTPRVEPRYLFPFIWSFYLVLAWCVWRIGRAQRVLGVAAALLVVVLSGAADQQYYASRVPNDVYQSLTATLRAYRLPGDGVVLHDDRTWPIFEYYYASGNKDWKGVPNGSRIKPGDAGFILSDYWESHDAVWLAWNEDALRIDDSHALEQWLSARSVYTSELTFGTKRLVFYARTAERASKAGSLASAARPTYVMNTTVADGLTLEGYDQAIRRYRVGDEILLATYWHSTRATGVVAALQDAHGVEHARQDLAVSAGDSRMLVRYPVTTDLAPEEYHIVVSAAGAPVTVAQAEVDASDIPETAPDVTIQTPLAVHFQNGIQLMGYDAGTTTLHPGDNLLLTLYWQTDQPIGQHYKVFVHLLGTVYNSKSKNLLWGQQDQEPLNGALPTTAWGTHRMLSDPYAVHLAPDAPPGRYVVEVGLYDATSGARLPIGEAGGPATGDHVNLFEVDVQ